MLDIWQRGMTMKEIGRQYGLSACRVQQIVDRERKRKAIKTLPTPLIASLESRLEALSSDLIPMEIRTNMTINGIFMPTIRYLKWQIGSNFSPKEWVEWLKQATDEEIYGIRGIGNRKGRILITIRNDIQRGKAKRERDLIYGTERLY